LPQQNGKEMKTTKTSKKDNIKFQTPNEAKTAAKAEVKPETKKPETERDAFGGRVGSRMSKVNLAVIRAGATGASVPEVVAATGESSSIVSAQLHWVFSAKKLATRKPEVLQGGRKTFRYFPLGKVNS
jgi:hypothetical protein